MRPTPLIIAAAIALCPLAAGAQEVMSATGAAGKVLEDPAENGAFAEAMAVPDARGRSAALQAFAQRYPYSPHMLEASQRQLADDQQINDSADAERAAKRIVQIAPDDVPALAILVYLARMHASGLPNGDARTALADEAAADAGRGLTALPAWPGPSGMQPADVETLRGRLGAIFYAGLGFERLAKADYQVARYYYLKAVAIDPADVQTDYELALVDLQAKPLDPEGFWWAAKAYLLAGAANAPASQAAIAPLARDSYRSYHGGEDGWADLLGEVSGQSTPPPGFTIKAAPGPAEIAVQAVQDNDVSSLTVPDWEFILSYRDASDANAAAAAKVWASITTGADGAPARLKLPVKIISAGRGTLEAAITDDNQQAGRVDLHVILAAPLSRPPAPGTMVTVIGLPSTYTPQPFAFTLKDAQIAG